MMDALNQALAGIGGAVVLFAVIVGVLAFIEWMSERRKKSAEFVARINAALLRIDGLESMHWDMAERVRVAGSKGWAVREQVDQIEQELEAAAIAAELMANKLLGLTHRIEQLETLDLFGTTKERIEKLDDQQRTTQTWQQITDDELLGIYRRLDALELNERAA